MKFNELTFIVEEISREEYYRIANEAIDMLFKVNTREEFYRDIVKTGWYKFLKKDFMDLPKDDYEFPPSYLWGAVLSNPKLQSFDNLFDDNLTEVNNTVYQLLPLAGFYPVVEWADNTAKQNRYSASTRVRLRNVRPLFEKENLKFLNSLWDKWFELRKQWIESKSNVRNFILSRKKKDLTESVTHEQIRGVVNDYFNKLIQCRTVLDAIDLFKNNTVLYDYFIDEDNFNIEREIKSIIKYNDVVKTFEEASMLETIVPRLIKMIVKYLKAVSMGEEAVGYFNRTDLQLLNYDWDKFNTAKTNWLDQKKIIAGLKKFKQKQ
jgi:hypothetical protein